MPKTIKTKRLDELDLLFSESDPLAVKPKQPKRRDTAQEFIQAPSADIHGFSTWKLLRELYKRYSAKVYAVGFWVGLAIIIFIKVKG